MNAIRDYFGRPRVLLPVVHCVSVVAQVLGQVELAFDARAVRVAFCPGCGTKAPPLKLQASPTFHRDEADEDGHCLRCGERYCSRGRPAHLFEIASPAGPKE